MAALCNNCGGAQGQDCTCPRPVYDTEETELPWS